MHFSTALATLSAFALMSTSMAVPRSASFVTWNNPTCNGDESGTHRYNELDDTAPCASLPEAVSIKVYYTRNANCKVNTFSGPGCSGDVVSYNSEQRTNMDAPCRLVTGKVSYNVTC